MRKYLKKAAHYWDIVREPLFTVAATVFVFVSIFMLWKEQVEVATWYLVMALLLRLESLVEYIEYPAVKDAEDEDEDEHDITDVYDGRYWRSHNHDAS